MAGPFAVGRRQVLQTAASTLLIAALADARAWARGRPAELDLWARDLASLESALRSGDIDIVEWQARVERLNASVPVSELTAYLDVEAVTRGFRYASKLAEVGDPILPAEVLGPRGMRKWFLRIFGLRRGGAIVPHVHNNMVSAHLVISGRFHVRTHDRLRDLDDAVVLRQTRDEALGVGGVLSMSDRRDNQHWMVALEDRAMTFDVGVLDLPASWDYGLPANRYSMIFVDPDRPPQRDGTIVAPVLSFEQAVAKFAT